MEQSYYTFSSMKDKNSMYWMHGPFYNFGEAMSEMRSAARNNYLVTELVKTNQDGSWEFVK